MNIKTSSIEIAKQTLDIEISALQRMRDLLNNDFEKAVETILKCRGRVVVIGMGKSGIIGKKIAATLASTGTPAFFVHPGEAFHGDLGMIRDVDIALLISNSGETEEVLRVLPFLEWQKIPIIALTGKHDSTLARHAHFVLDVSVEREACANNLAPTSSTTNTLAMGDALAIALTVKREFKPEDFARFHPGGSLGKRLLTRVRDAMKKEKLPVCAPDDSFREVINSITYGRMGLTLVLENEKLKGIITDGDLRRAIEKTSNFEEIKANNIMTHEPLTINADCRLSEAEKFMREKKVSALVVLNEDGKLEGVLQIFD